MERSGSRGGFIANQKLLHVQFSQERGGMRTRKGQGKGLESHWCSSSEGGRNIGPVIGKIEEETISERGRKQSTLLEIQEAFSSQTGPLTHKSEIKNSFEVMEMEKKVVNF